MVSLAGIALSLRLESKEFMVVLLILLRILQGFGSCAIQVTCYAVSGQLYSEHQARVIGFIEGSCMLGMTISSIVGASLYQAGGIDLPYFGFAALFCITAMLTNQLAPQSVDGDGDQESEELEDDISSSDQIRIDCKPPTTS